MSDSQYTYAVAAIRVKESRLFSAAVIEQLIACPSYESCIQFLIEKGWGEADTPLQAEAILSCEERKTRETLTELVKDENIIAVLDYPKVFHNLKAAVKEYCTSQSSQNIYIEGTVPSPERIKELVKERKFESLPEIMSHAAKEAYEALLHNSDGQMCDIIIDRACLEAINAAGEKAKEPVIKAYAQTQVAAADIKTAVRCAKTGKPAEFVKAALAKCSLLNTDALVKSALGGMDALLEYFSKSGFDDAAEALKKSYSEFEKWCDNSVIEALRPQKYNAFSAGPVVAYVLARQIEIKTVRIILTCKQNGLPDDSIRERIREMYV